MLTSDNAHDLALLFHLNSEPWMNAAAFQAPPGELPRSPGTEAAVSLPPVASTPLTALLGERRSCRRYLAGEMPLASLAAVLQAGYGTGPLVRGADGRRVTARPAPSAGGYYPLSLFAVTSAVAGLSDGLHRYDPWQHALRTMRTGPVRTEADACLLAPQFAIGANALLFLAAPLDPMLEKYGPRGYRYLLLEAGHVAQSICLAACEAQLATLCIGGFVDRAVDRLLGLRERMAASLYCIALGRPSALPELSVLSGGDGKIG
jgi:SagB-type dehydrogenase family enzyme